MSENTPRPSIRWWPAAVILGLTAALLVYNALRSARDLQERVVFTFPVFAGTAALLFLWAVLFSRLRGRIRLAIFAVVLLLGAGFAGLFRISGVDGDLVPVFSYRWGGPDTYADAADAAGDVQPGPDDYPQFYGPRRDATLPGPRLARDWKAKPPREIWRHPVGEGWSSFAVVGQAAVTQEQRSEQEVVVRYELLTGREVWVHGIDENFVTTVGGIGPRATPTVAGGRVYSLGATGVLSCLDLNDGSPLWSTNVLEDHDTGIPDWGMSSSPLLVDDLVVVQLGRVGRGIAAYRREDGSLAWQSGDDWGSYSSPVLATVSGVEQILAVHTDTVTSHHPVTGRILWRQDLWSSTAGARVTPPIVLDDERLLFSSGYGVGSRLLRVQGTLDDDGNGGFLVQELWRSPRLKSKFAPVVQRDGVVYGLDEGILTAIDPATGDRIWKKGRYGHGQLILVDDLLLVLTEKGDLVLVEAHPEEHRELSRIQAFNSKTWNPPALSGRYLLVRNNREAACYELPLEG